MMDTATVIKLMHEPVALPCTRRSFLFSTGNYYQTLRADTPFQCAPLEGSRSYFLNVLIPGEELSFQALISLDG